MLKSLIKEVRSLADPKRAKTFAWFFKTGPGQYGEGDKFLGLTTPQIRLIVKKYYQLPLSDIQKLIKSKFHEERSVAISILVHKFLHGSDSTREEIFKFYLSHTQWINNWDLVDISAPKIVGTYLLDKSPDVLFELAKSDNLWERRISIVSTYAFICETRPELTLKISKLLLADKHDLIHKAVGWMLREVGKRCGEKHLTDFLDSNLKLVPRTALRYAIERFPESTRQKYLKGDI